TVLYSLSLHDALPIFFSILLAVCVCLLSDRVFSTHFFPLLNFVANQRSGVIPNAVPVLWQRLFWFFAQAEVYVAMLPCFGLTTRSEEHTSELQSRSDL